MNARSRICTAFTCASMLAPGWHPALAETSPPKVNSSDFLAKLAKDASPLPNHGQLQMSYATVVEKILPSVVTIYSSFAHSFTASSAHPKILGMKVMRSRLPIHAVAASHNAHRSLRLKMSSISSAASVPASSSRLTATS